MRLLLRSIPPCISCRRKSPPSATCLQHAVALQFSSEVATIAASNHDISRIRSALVDSSAMHESTGPLSKNPPTNVVKALTHHLLQNVGFLAISLTLVPSFRVISVCKSCCYLKFEHQHPQYRTSHLVYSPD